MRQTTKKTTKIQAAEKLWPSENILSVIKIIFRFEKSELWIGSLSFASKTFRYNLYGRKKVYLHRMCSFWIAQRPSFYIYQGIKYKTRRMASRCSRTHLREKKFIIKIYKWRILKITFHSSSKEKGRLAVWGEYILCQNQNYLIIKWKKNAITN